MDLQKLKNFIKSKKIFLLVVLCFFIILINFTMSLKEKQKALIYKNNETKDIGISVGGADQQAYMARLEKNYYDFEERVKGVEVQLKNIQSVSEQLNNSQRDIAQSVLKLDQSLGMKMEQKLDGLKSDLELSFDKQNEHPLKEDVELSVANIGVTSNNDLVYLPIGSFCKGTLLTGVYAAADANNPLPVLISLDEAFFGPNKTRIPLKGAFVLGKAYGELVSERALIQIVAISTVLPSGHAFESEQDLGYVTDEFGELGIRGQIIYNTGRQLALSFMGGFVSGGAQSIADSQVTTHQTIQGDTTKNVTGSGAKNSLFSGLAQGAGKLASFYEKQAEDLVPAIHIKNGAKVFFIVQKGVTINGLVKSDFDHKRYMD